MINTKKAKQLLPTLVGAALLGLAATPAQALKIELINTGGVTVGSDVYKGFQEAARFWEMALTNDVTVRLNVRYAGLGAGILGSTGSTTNGLYVSDVLSALQSAGNSVLDQTASSQLVASRPSTVFGGAIDAVISGPKTNGTGVAVPLTRVLDNDGSFNNSALSVNTSLMKAIGYAPVYAANNPTQADGSITFSSNFAFDFDPTNGIDANKFDFLGVAIHEIGHALGFRSGVDIYDANTNFAGNLNNQFFMTVWDLFRYSADSASKGARDWAIGGNPYFSIDGGASIYGGNGRLATGRNFGDGQQASHWKDSVMGQPQLGVMDPTSGFGQQQIIDSLDLAAFDAMGWNVAYDVMWLKDREFSTADIARFTTLQVPVPGVLGLALGALGLMAGLRRRRA